MTKGRRGGSRPRTGSGDYNMFPAGAAVEVRSNEEGFRGVWYEANIVRHKPRRRRYEVVYSLLVVDNNPCHPLRELVRRSNIRPRPPPPPPPVSQAHYSLHDLVEAFHKDGWWSGVVAALFAGPTSTAFLVAFPSSREEHAFEASYLRPQLHWRSGDWVPAAQLVDQPASTKCQGADGPPFSLAARVEVSRIREDYGAAWFTAIVLKILNSSTFLVEYENLQAEIGSDMLTEYVDAQYIRSYLPNALAKEFDIDDEVEVIYCGGWAPGKISKIDGSQFLVKLLHLGKEIQFGHDQMRPARIWNGKEWVFDFQRKNNRLQSRSTRSKWKSQTGKRCSPISVSISSDEGEHAFESVSVKLTSLESLQPCKNMVTMLLEYNNTPKCNLLVDCPSTAAAEIDQSTSMKIIKNNSSREQHHSEVILPPYVLPDKPLNQHQLPNVNGGAANESQEVNDASCGYQMKETQLNASPVSSAMNFLPKLKEREDEGSSGSHVSFRKRKFKVLARKTTHQHEAAGDDGVGQHAEDENGRRDDSSSCLFGDNPQQLCEKNNILENILVQPLTDIALSSYETPVSCGTTDSAKCCTEGPSVPSKVGEVLAEIHQSETPLGTTIEDEGVLIVPCPSEPRESEILLPFSRSSAMWQSIEAMEVFRIMPQNPHFRLLEQYSIEFREGMAIGLMVSFANLATNIKQLHIDDAQYTLEERMRALVLLEENGFDVRQLRSWLQKLLEIHRNRSHSRRQFEARKASVEAKISEKKADNVRLQSFITSVDKTIMELEQNLTSAHETKDSAILQKSLNNSEISKLEMNIREIEKSYNSTEASFRATSEKYTFS